MRESKTIKKWRKVIERYLKLVEHEDGGVWKCQEELKRLVEKR